MRSLASTRIRESESAYFYARQRDGPLLSRQRFPFARAWFTVQMKVQREREQTLDGH